MKKLIAFYNIFFIKSFRKTVLDHRRYNLGLLLLGY